MIVLRAAGLQLRGGGMVTAGDAVPSAGELAVFCRPVVTAPAVVRRDGTVLADAWLRDLVRLGELERHLGAGVIEAVVDAALAKGRLRRRQRRRLMSYPLVIRLMLATALMPDASYCEALARLAGLLADIPFALAWHVATEKVATDWRILVPADLKPGENPRSTCSPPDSPSPPPRTEPARKEEPPGHPGPRTVEPRANPPRHAGRIMPAHHRRHRENGLEGRHRTPEP
ncbi:MAG TPA: hypothetical protein VF940_09815 [Streptosporangiaceae bacterium]